MSDQRRALAVVDALAAVLRKEISAVESGQFEALVAFAGEKARLTSALEKYLQDDPAAVSKPRLAELKDLILRDKRNLELAQTATADMIREIRTLRERHSVAGLYGTTGARRDIHATNGGAVDKTV
ncbi:hypothetical protein DU478_14740 [Thalassococcus profundi]|uniref:Flagellar protein FlgN n=1 Tax=Thalassococcus profundi TaxID=2282382 RepID=A0A369TL77_9RHOB|nr:hypothetical protein DU478_14740 [Thalassococcus profundi]